MQVYLHTRLNRKQKDFTVQFRGSDFLTEVAKLNGTAKWKGFPIGQGVCKRFTALAAPGRSGEFREVRAQSKGCDGLTAAVKLGSVRTL
jgi:hypothetical protein